MSLTGTITCIHDRNQELHHMFILNTWPRTRKCESNPRSCKVSRTAAGVRLGPVASGLHSGRKLERQPEGNPDTYNLDSCHVIFATGGLGASDSDHSQREPRVRFRLQTPKAAAMKLRLEASIRSDQSLEIVLG